MKINFTIESMNLKPKLNIILYFLLLSSFTSCDEDNINNCINKVSVNEQLFIGNITSLQTLGAYVISNAGINGIVIKRNSIAPAKFTTFDLQAPHLCPNEKCSKLSLSQDQITLEGCDGSSFLLSTGQPIKISSLGLISYNVSYNERTSTLTILD